MERLVAESNQTLDGNRTFFYDEGSSSGMFIIQIENTHRSLFFCLFIRFLVYICVYVSSIFKKPN